MTISLQLSVCKQPETFRTPIQHFGRKVNQEIKLFKTNIFFSKNKKKIVKEKFTLPAPQFNMQNSQPVLSHQQNGSMQVHISRAICGPRTLRHCFQVIETRWSMQMSWPKSCCVHSKQNSRHLQNGSESQEMKFPWSSWHLEAQWFKLSPWRCVYVLGYSPISDAICHFIAKGDQGNSYGEVVALLG